MRIFLFILLTSLFAACSPSIFKAKWTTEKAPQIFSARFETTKGVFDIEVKREWSPLAVDRLYALLKHHFFDNALFYRGVSNFVVQFGSSDTVKIVDWNKYVIPDEKVVYGNYKGSISFARAGKDTRGTELFINLKNNLSLDTTNYGGVKGFPAFGNVTRGMDVVDSIYTGYGDKTMDILDTLYQNRTRFLAIFPKLDSITRAYIIKSGS